MRLTKEFIRQQALTPYDKNKGLLRRYFIGDHDAIQVLRNLSRQQEPRDVDVVRCFLNHKLYKGRASYEAYWSILTKLFGDYQHIGKQLLKKCYELKKLDDYFDFIVNNLKPNTVLAKYPDSFRYLLNGRFSVERLTQCLTYLEQYDVLLHKSISSQDGSQELKNRIISLEISNFIWDLAKLNRENCWDENLISLVANGRFRRYSLFTIAWPLQILKGHFGQITEKAILWFSKLPELNFIAHRLVEIAQNEQSNCLTAFLKKSQFSRIPIWLKVLKEQNMSITQEVLEALLSSSEQSEIAKLEKDPVSYVRDKLPHIIINRCWGKNCIQFSTDKLNTKTEEMIWESFWDFLTNNHEKMIITNRNNFDISIFKQLFFDKLAQLTHAPKSAVTETLESPEKSGNVETVKALAQNSIFTPQMREQSSGISTPTIPRHSPYSPTL